MSAAGNAVASGDAGAAARATSVSIWFTRLTMSAIGISRVIGRPRMQLSL
ncbi:MAG TPA: hypothetical protein VGK92_02675 [Gaiellales bacterium]